MLQPKNRRLVTEKNLENHTESAVRPVREAATQALADADQAIGVSEEAKGDSTNAISRVEALETMGGLNPGEVTDAQTANLIHQPETQTRTVLDERIGDTITTAVTEQDSLLNATYAKESGQVARLVPEPLDPTFTARAPHMVWLTRDGRTRISVGARIRFNKDGGAFTDNTFNFPTDPRAVRELGDGEILVGIMPEQGGAVGGSLWKSSGWPTDPENATFTRVLQFISPVAYTTAYWSIDTLPDGRVLAAEYGNKVDTQRVYYSTDDAETWDVILNAGDLDSNMNHDSLHIHGVRFDPFWDRIWVSIGDLETNARVVYTDDEGETWNTILAQYDTQVVDIIPFETCLLLTTDASPNGIIRIHRLPGRELSEPEYAVLLNNNKHRDPSGFGHLAYQRAPGYPWFITWSSSGTPGPGVLWTTMDGLDIHEIWRDSPEHELPRSGMWSALGPTADGQIYGTVAYSGRFNDAATVTFRAPYPEWLPETHDSDRLVVHNKLVSPRQVGVAPVAENSFWPTRMVTAKAEDTHRTSLTAPINDWELVFNRLAPNSIWAIRGVLYVNVEAETGLKATVDAVHGTGYFSLQGPTPDGASIAAAAPLYTTAFPLGANHDVGVRTNGIHVVRIDASVSFGDLTSAINLRWSQSASNSEPTTLLAGSYLVAERVDAGSLGDNFPGAHKL